MRVARGPFGIPLPSMPGPKTLYGVGAGTLGFPASADMDLGVLLESPQGSQSSSRVGAWKCAFLPICTSSVALPFRGSRDLWLSLEAFPRGFPTNLSHRALPRATAATAREDSARACPHSRRGLTPWGDSRSTRTSMSALERNPQVPAPTPHKVLGPSIDGGGIPRGHRATRMGTGPS